MSTLIDVAKLAGVSVTTISRMLNNRVKVSDKTRSKILSAMKELNYQPDEIAQSLTKKRSNFIGLIVPSAKNFFFSQVIEYTEYYAVEKGYKLLLCISNHETSKEVEYFGMLRANKVAGIILASRTQNLLEYLVIDSPVICIDRIISPEIPTICSDNYHGGVLAAEHLLDKGCKNIAYISGSAELDFEANKRFLGLSEACRLAAVTAPVFINAAEERFFSMDYQGVIAELFETNPQVDGILTSNDIIAAQVLQYCTRQGILIPEEIRLIGYDDTDLASLCTPTISTIHQPIKRMCQIAVEGLHQLSTSGASITSQILPVTLKKRQTT